MNDRLYLPALQGGFGDWVFYVALVPLGELAERVGYARELQSNSKLSELIQRSLDDEDRASDIAEYLMKTRDRFFNSLVVGVHDGRPSWHPFSLGAAGGKHELGAVVERDQDLVGYLELRGDERLFALDGQHRLAGIKKALQEDRTLAEEKVTVLFVAHAATAAGVRRTRSLFISLNKKAVPVRKRDIIVLDEVDLPAIITRRLLDDHPWFSRGQVDFESFGSSLPPTSPAWTTIGNFYDTNEKVLDGIIEDAHVEELKEARRLRLPEERIDHYQALVVDFYARLGRLDRRLASVFSGRDPASTVGLARTGAEPHVLFRPVGLKIIARVALNARKQMSLDASFEVLSSIPMLLSEAPFAGIVWDVERERMITRGESLCTRLLLYMLRLAPRDEKLTNAYADWFGLPREKVRLPATLRATATGRRPRASV